MEKRSIAAVSLAAIILISLFTVVAVPFMSDDMDGEVFEYRIVGQDADGFITGSMVLEVGYVGDGMYDLVLAWTVSYPDGIIESGSTTLSFRSDAFWTDGEHMGEKGLFTYWGRVPAEVYRTGDTELYVCDGILYEAVHECDGDLVIVQLTGSGYLGEGTVEPHLFSYVMEAEGFTRHGGEEVDVTGTIEVERHDATGTHVLDSTRYDLAEGGEPLDDPLIISWDPIDADDAEFSGLETVWTSAWGTVDTVRYSSDQGGRFVWWLYDDFITVEMVSLYTEDDGSLLFIEAETVSIVLDGDEVTDISEISGLADEW